MNSAARLVGADSKRFSLGTVIGLGLSATFFGGLFYFGATTSKRDAELSELYSRAERIRWRESTLWGETPEEEAISYKAVAPVPGRLGPIPPEQPHYEPVNLVSNGTQYQPMDRWVDSNRPFKV